MPTTEYGTIKFATVDITAAPPQAPAVVPSSTGYRPVIVGYTLAFTGTGSPSFKFNRGATDLSGTFDQAGVYSAWGTRITPLMSGTLSNTIQITTAGTTASVRGIIAYYYMDSA